MQSGRVSLSKEGQEEDQFTGGVAPRLLVDGNSRLLRLNVHEMET